MMNKKIIPDNAIQLMLLLIGLLVTIDCSAFLPAGSQCQGLYSSGLYPDDAPYVLVQVLNKTSAMIPYVISGQQAIAGQNIDSAHTNIGTALSGTIAANSSIYFGWCGGWYQASRMSTPQRFSQLSIIAGTEIFTVFAKGKHFDNLNVVDPSTLYPPAIVTNVSPSEGVFSYHIVGSHNGGAVTDYNGDSWWPHNQVTCQNGCAGGVGFAVTTAPN